MNPAIFHADDPPGPSGRLLRLHRNLPWMLEKYPGDIVEIGVGYGVFTKVFLEMADRFDRRVLAIDPWDYHDGIEPRDKSDKGYGYTYEKFRDNVGTPRRLDVCRASSSSAEALAFMDRSISFVMLDGRMDEAGLSEDMEIASTRSRLFSVDDYGFRDVVRKVLDKWATNHKDWSLVHSGSAHEAYFFKL